MPYTYLPERSYLRINHGLIELVHDGEVLFTMTPEEARSNAADLIQAAEAAEKQRGERTG